MDTLYKARLIAQEEGLTVWIDRYYPVRETPCYYFCVTECDKWRVGSSVLPLKDKMLKRIHKTNSRFAFETEDLAIEHLRLMKTRQMVHMSREFAFINSFLGCDELTLIDSNTKMIPHTRGLVSKYINFD